MWLRKTTLEASETIEGGLRLEAETSQKGLAVIRDLVHWLLIHSQKGR